MFVKARKGFYTHPGPKNKTREGGNADTKERECLEEEKTTL